MVNGLLDPLFIFYFGWGLEGAAWASFASRIAMLLVAWHVLFSVHQLPQKVNVREFLQDLKSILQIAVPAVLTNLATPIGASFVLLSMAQFGDGAVAGAAIMGRISPLAFAAVFALSSAVGPILAQNAGAGLYDRVRSTLMNAVGFGFAYVLIIWLVLWWCADFIVWAFSASPDAAQLILFYCHWLVPAFIFNGTLFIANASFNNLHHPQWATAFNFGKMVLGTIPCVYFGALWYGPRGVMAGEAIGSIVFGIFSLVAALALVRRLAGNYTEAAGNSAGL